MLRLLVHQPLSCSNTDLHRWVVQQEKSSCSRHFFQWSTVCWKSIPRYFLAVNTKLFIRQHLASSMTIFTLVKGWNLTALAFNLLGALPLKVRDRKRFTKRRPRRWSPYQQGHITLNFHLQVLRNHKSETFVVNMFKVRRQHKCQAAALPCLRWEASLQIQRECKASSIRKTPSYKETPRKTHAIREKALLLPTVVGNPLSSCFIQQWQGHTEVWVFNRMCACNSPMHHFKHKHSLIWCRDYTIWHQL